MDTLTGLTKGIRAHQAHEEENNRISVKQALDKSVELKRDLAVRKISSNYLLLCILKLARLYFLYLLLSVYRI